MSFPHLDLSRSPHDRQGLRRNDQSWLDERWQHPRSRVLVVAGTRVRPGATGPEWIPAATAPDGVRVLLGDRDGTPHWAVIVSGEVVKEDEGAWVPLRGLLSFLDAADEGTAPLLFHALGLAEWHWAMRHCPRCGGVLTPRASGHELHCADCGKTQFPRSDPAVIMVITDGEPGAADERCLLGRHPSWPAGRFSTLAGFCEPGETLEDTVRREVAEETGVLVGDVSYFGNQPWPLPASLMLGFTGRAVRTEIVLEDDDVEEARWFTRAEMADQTRTGDLVLPSGVSISRSLIEHWYGGPLPGSW